MPKKTNNHQDFIEVIGAKQHNLKSVNVKIPKNKLTVVTGLSGSGKSSLAFDTIYAEGQRRYVESLSSYARQFLNLQDKPNVEYITGLSPAIAINQKTTSKNPRSTVSTATEIYDYMRLLYARIGVPHSPTTGLPLTRQTSAKMFEDLIKFPKGTYVKIMSPVAKGEKGEHKKKLLEIRKAGFKNVIIDGDEYKLIPTVPKLERTKRHDIQVIVEKVCISEEFYNRLKKSLDMALALSNGLALIEFEDLPEGVKNIEYKGKYFKMGDSFLLSEKYSCEVSGFTIDEVEPRLFSFNSPFGACEKCDGLGTELRFNTDLIVPDISLSLSEGAITPFLEEKPKYYEEMLKGLAKHYGFSMNISYQDLSEDAKRVLLYGAPEEIEINYDDGYRTFKLKKSYEGVMNILEKRWNEAKSDWIRDELTKYQSICVCSSCGSHRLNQKALAVKILDQHIGKVCDLSINQALEFFNELPQRLNEIDRSIGEKVISEVIRRLNFLQNVGLGYLTLNRGSSTLSGGEAQRIRLASQIGSGLSGVLYVLDEPSIGLHQSDNIKLIETMKQLRDLGNTVIVVEHDEETMRAADYLIDVGPGAGIHGGQIISQGTPEEVINDPNSITGQYLSKKRKIEFQAERRPVDEKKMIKIKNARANNLKNLDVDIPLGLFCSISGISGGGKSSLVIHTLYKALSKIINGSSVVPGPYDKIIGISNVDKIIKIDQSAIGRTPRSNPCTYVGAFTLIRELFTALPESRARGYKLGRFSFNVKGGRCETCQGDGMLKIEMHFLPDVYVKCSACEGKRYNKETLEIRYKGKSIANVLNMTVEEAVEFFKDKSLIYEKFKALNDVGLGYIKIGQSATTLSGGEAQRIKLAKELSKKSTGNTIYILDEPTTGLHADDVNKLLSVLHKLVNQGNSVIVIEHNIDVLKTSDWILDIGPTGGEKGGYVVAEGTPEQVAHNKNSITGKYIKSAL